MANFRVQVSNYAAGALPRDYYTNVLYYTGTAPADDTAWNAFLDNIKAAFATTGCNANGHYDLRAYNMADPKPRPQKAHKVYSGTDGIIGPPEVALCLSYFSTRNLPRFRGRIYTGPGFASDTGKASPVDATVNALLGLGQKLKNAGTTAGLVWSMHSVTDNDYLAITDCWVDNAWDTQRKRGLRPTSRARATLT